MPAVARRSGAPLEPFLDEADPGLRGALAACLAAAEVLQLARGSRRARAALALPPPAGPGVCCPHLRPGSAGALAAAVVLCEAQQLRSLRPTGDFSSLAYLPELVARLGGFARLEELGPLYLDGDSGSPEAGAAGGGAGDAHGMAPPPPTTLSLLPALGDGLARCRLLGVLDLTLHCTAGAAARGFAGVLLPAVGTCRCLRELRLVMDTSMPCGGAAMAGLASALQGLSEWRQLRLLSLGYLWWTEASEDTVDLLRDSLRALDGSVRTVAVRYPQDQEFGGLDVACASVLEGVGRYVEEVSIVEAWGNDGTGLRALAETLADCGRLRRVDLLGVLPPGLDWDGFAAEARQSSAGAEILANAPDAWDREGGAGGAGPPTGLPGPAARARVEELFA